MPSRLQSHKILFLAFTLVCGAVLVTYKVMFSVAASYLGALHLDVKHEWSVHHAGVKGTGYNSSLSSINSSTFTPVVAVSNPIMLQNLSIIDIQPVLKHLPPVHNPLPHPVPNHLPNHVSNPTPTAVPIAVPNAIPNPVPNAMSYPLATEVCIPDPNKKLSIILSGRLGNQIFMYASLFGLSKSSCRTASYYGQNVEIRHLFSNLTIPFANTTGTTFLTTERGFGIYEDAIVSARSSEPHIHLDKTYLQSWRYFANYESDIRKEFQLKEDVKRQSKDFLDRTREKVMFGKEIPSSLVFVGIHVRRGDLLNINLQSIGYLTPGMDYFHKAMDYFRNKYSPVHFLVASDDMKWITHNFGFPDVTLTGQTALLDFAILSQCDHLIASSGSYSWWAAWLTGGEVVYRDPPFGPGSSLDKLYRIEDYYPASWIGMHE